MYQWITYFHWLTVISAFLCFSRVLGLMGEETHDSIFFRTSSCGIVGQMYLSCFVVCIPYLINLSLDFSFKEESHDLIERLIFVLTFVARSLVLYLVLMFKPTNKVAVFWAIESLTPLAFSACMFSLCNKHRPDIWSGKRVFWISVFLNTSYVFRALFTGSECKVCFDIIGVMHLFGKGGCAFLLYCTAKSSYQQCNGNISSLNNRNVKCLVYSVIPFIFSTGLLLYLFLSRPQDMNGERVFNSISDMAVIMVSQFLGTVILETFPQRLLTSELHRNTAALKNNAELLQTKRSVMRHMFHEMRTPLNLVSMGIKLLKVETNSAKKRAFSSSSSHATETENQSWKSDTQSALPPSDAVVDLIGQIDMSCATTLELLNEMLLYDKLEAGLFTLELTMVPVHKFLTATLQPFSVAAQHKGIELNLLNSFEERFSNLVINAEDDTQFVSWENFCIRVDVSKMGQVLRNFASNALKFTPKGGSVSVEVTYKPPPVKPEDLDSLANSQKFVPGFQNGKNPFVNLRGKKHSQIYIQHSIDSEQPDDNPVQSNMTRDRDSSCDSGIRTMLGRNESRESEGSIIISFVDTGAGLSAENMTHLFNEVVQFRANELQEGGGSGFGLKISKGIVDLHGGTVGVSSPGEGQGSTFFIELPLLVISQPQAAAVSTRSQDGNWIYDRTDDSGPGRSFVSLPRIVEDARSDRSDKFVAVSSKGPSVDQSIVNSLKYCGDSVMDWVGPKRVLVVDDSKLTRKLTCRLVEQMGNFACEEACDGAAAVELVKLQSTGTSLAASYSHSIDNGDTVGSVHKYAAILMDNIMPLLDGPSATEIIRHELGFTGLIIGITGLTNENDVNRFMTAGATRVLDKPVDVEKLKSILISVVPE